MSKQASKTLIGAFVVGSIILLVAAIVVFGSGRLFSKAVTFVMYFQGSVAGLSEGAPLVFRGVKVGSVTDIVLVFDPERISVDIPVFAEMDPDAFKRVNGDQKRRDPKEIAAILVDRGLRAQLQSQSLVTGQLMIGLDFYPDTPARLVGRDPEYPEIPTIPSRLQAISETIEQLPLQDLVANLTSALQGINQAVNSPELTGTLRETHETVSRVGILAESLNNRVSSLGGTLEGTLAEARGFIKTANGEIDGLQASLRQTSEAATAALAQIEKTTQGMEGTIGERSTLNYELNNTLRELRMAARSFRNLTDYLEQHPEALLRGKQ